MWCGKQRIPGRTRIDTMNMMHMPYSCRYRQGGREIKRCLIQRAMRSHTSVEVLHQLVAKRVSLQHGYNHRRRLVEMHAKGKKKGKSKAPFISNGDEICVQGIYKDIEMESVIELQEQLDLNLGTHKEESVPVVQYNTNTMLAQYLRPLPRVLLVHTGGTLGMDPGESYVDEGVQAKLKEGTGGVYPSSDNLQPGAVLSDLMTAVPELSTFASLDIEIVFNMDSCRVGPKQWIQLAKLLHKHRQNYDAFLIVHGTDTMSFTAAALSLMLAGFRKPIVLTGSQLPLAMPRSDARQNLIDAITCATAGYIPDTYKRYPVHLEEVAICFGGRLMRGNRSRKTHSSIYAAFDSPMYPYLAELGVEIEWNNRALLHLDADVYQPRFKLNPSVIRIPIVPGVDPRKAYGDLYGRGVRGVVLEVFGVGNMPDNPSHGWLPWLKQQRRAGLQVYLCSQCSAGSLHPELYRSGSVALNMGVESGRQMTPECAVVKMMFCLEYHDIPLSQPIAGEL